MEFWKKNNNIQMTYLFVFIEEMLFLKKFP